MKASPAIQKVPREHLERLAMNMRRKARNAAMDKARLGQRVGAVILGLGAAGGMGYIVGQRIQAGQSTDIGGWDMELVIGASTTLLGVLAQGKTGWTRKIGEYAESAGMGILAYYAGSRGEDMGANATAA